MIQFIGPINLIKLMNGSAWQLPNVICPFGNIISFLYDYQVTQVQYFNSNLNYKNVFSQYSRLNETTIKFVLDSKESYHDHSDQFFDVSSVERKIENMLDIENLDNQLLDCSDYDRHKIEGVTNIEYKNKSNIYGPGKGKSFIIERFNVSPENYHKHNGCPIDQ